MISELLGQQAFHSTPTFHIFVDEATKQWFLDAFSGYFVTVGVTCYLARQLNSQEDGQLEETVSCKTSVATPRG